MVPAPPEGRMFGVPCALWFIFVKLSFLIFFMDDYVDYLKKFPRRSAAKGGGAGSIGADPKFTEAPLA